MGNAVTFLMVVGCYALAMCALAWLGLRVRRRGITDAVIDTANEIFHPAAHRFRAEIQVHDERMIPMTPAEDQWDWKPGEAGRA